MLNTLQVIQHSHLRQHLTILFSKHRLSFSKVRVQGYNEVINMRREFNDLKTLILKESRYVYCIH